jgi:hypothetical protein
VRGGGGVRKDRGGGGGGEGEGSRTCPEVGEKGVTTALNCSRALRLKKPLTGGISGAEGWLSTDFPIKTMEPFSYKQSTPKECTTTSREMPSALMHEYDSTSTRAGGVRREWERREEYLGEQ